MKARVFVLALVCALAVLASSGCGPTTVEPEETPSGGGAGLPNPASVYCEEQGGALEIRTDESGGQYGVCIFPDGSECEEWAFFRGECSPGGEEEEEAAGPPEEVQAAFDAALAYIAEHYGEAPAQGPEWSAEFTTPEGIVGSGDYRYSAGEWEATISYPIVAPDAVVYTIVVTHQATGFQWQGTVDAAGQVAEESAPAGGLPVVGWMGYVVSTPDGAQYDDYLVLMPEGAGEIGVEGATPEIEAEIVALRDHEEPGKYAHFWGTLTCDVPDYGGCQLVVTRLRVGPTYTEDEPIEGVQGLVVSNPPGSQFDDYLILDGDYPVGYGIHSLDPDLEAQLQGLRDTGQFVRLSGQLRTGVPDAFGSQIEVTELEVVGAPLTPSEGEGEPVDGWAGTVGKYPPGSQHGDYFEREDGERYDIGSQDAAVQQLIDEVRWTGAQIRVWGELFTGVPATEARHIEVERAEVVSGAATEARNLSPFATLEASSVLPSDRGGTYHAWSATNGLLDSPWVEGVDGPGIGEWITLTFPGMIEVHSIGLDVGFDRDDELFTANNRIRRATFVFDDEQVTLDFADERGVQLIPLVRAPGSNIQTTSIRMIIEEVYPGSQYDDTCLGEIEVWGITPYLYGATS